MPRLGDPRQTAINELSKVILSLMVPRFEYSTLVVRAKQHNRSPIAPRYINTYVLIYSSRINTRLDEIITLNIFLELEHSENDHRIWIGIVFHDRSTP